ncbi:hypothetical protein GCM10027046_10800 [Uliginosibacterium flavum]|uniref:Hpt domain-containing protein n=1 Tax=Uliginosibacterium flavum TaxID=1396831 RepID=A0ABV2TNM9_9RHOO
MAVDLSKFLGLYFEESAELLLRVDQVLRVAELADWRQAARAVHSIKGSSGAFGFEEIVDLAQLLESLLRQLERQEVPMTAARLVWCEEAVDGLRLLLKRRQQGLSGDAALTTAIGVRLGACSSDSAAACG